MRASLVSNRGLDSRTGAQAVQEAFWSAKTPFVFFDTATFSEKLRKNFLHQFGFLLMFLVSVFCHRRLFQTFWPLLQFQQFSLKKPELYKILVTEFNNETVSHPFGAHPRIWGNEHFSFVTFRLFSTSGLHFLFLSVFLKKSAASHTLV